jgi:hypothetical protein
VILCLVHIELTGVRVFDFEYKFGCSVVGALSFD